MSHYIHPVFPREHESHDVVQFNLETNEAELPQGSTDGYNKFYDNLEEFWRDLNQSERLREKLKIPKLAYHTYSFQRVGYDVAHVRNLIEWARGHEREVRAWVNNESALLIICIPDADMSENSGWDLYTYAQQNAKSYAAMGMSSWYEFCQFGVPIPDDWILVERQGRLIASAPNHKQFIILGS